MPARTSERLSLISRHFNEKLPLPQLNTPFSSERNTLPPDDIDVQVYKPSSPSVLLQSSKQTPATMSSQTPHSTLLIPGPIEFDDAVLQSMSHYA